MFRSFRATLASPPPFEEVRRCTHLIAERRSELDLTTKPSSRTCTKRQNARRNVIRFKKLRRWGRPPPGPTAPLEHSKRPRLAGSSAVCPRALRKWRCRRAVVSALRRHIVAAIHSPRRCLRDVAALSSPGADQQGEQDAPDCSLLRDGLLLRRREGEEGAFRYSDRSTPYRSAKQSRLCG